MSQRNNLGGALSFGSVPGRWNSGRPKSSGDWRRVGGTSMEVGLASPATGPCSRSGIRRTASRLFARTQAGRTFETADFENWTAAQGAPRTGGAACSRSGSSARSWRESWPFRPELPAGFTLSAAQLYRSDDGGRSWTNLTAFHSQSIIGQSQRSVAVSPADADQVTVANDFGVWRSMDGGMSVVRVESFVA